MDMYRGYLEARWQSAYDDYLSQIDAYEETLVALRAQLPDASSGRHAKVAAVSGLWDPDTRIRDLEADGVVADVIFPQGAVPFHRYPAQMSFLTEQFVENYKDTALLGAGVRAYNRWLAEFCATNPGRHAGVAVIPIANVEDSVQEVTWAKSAGLLGGILLPPITSSRPAYHDAIYEPLWNACDSLDMTLNVHGGGVQGYYGNGPEAMAIRLAETDWWMRRPIWYMTFAGVFERHRNLRLVFTEQRAHWVAPLLADLDSIYDSARVNGSTYLPSTPSEYFVRNCYVGASFLSRKEAEGLRDIGAECIMWGSDYPHSEGTWPWTLESIRKTFAEVPLEDVQLMLGENAARCYGLDVAQLRAVADRVGPTFTQIKEPLRERPEGSEFSWGFRDSAWT
jgi:predicted TIM-barrel fold metal-dependent hydrolase